MKAFVKALIAGLGYQVRGTRYCPRQLLKSTNLRKIEFDDVVCRRMFEVGPELTFIQVGAFDGVTKDPLRKYIQKCSWRGVVVEPQSNAANRLRELYDRRDKQIIVLQAAVDATVGKRSLFSVSAPSFPIWVGGLASFHRDTIIKHAGIIPGIDKMIIEEAVACITFDEVLAALPTKQIDLLQIDTEGEDGHILSLFPLENVRPSIIHWEVKHLSKSEREECLERLLCYGYKFSPSGDEDMLAVLDI